MLQCSTDQGSVAQTTTPEKATAPRHLGIGAGVFPNDKRTVSRQTPRGGGGLLFGHLVLFLTRMPKRVGLLERLGHLVLVALAKTSHRPPGGK